ncbi:hypothetical protein ANCDUO_17518, partial [Ancylostoma duodenale]
MMDMRERIKLITRQGTKIALLMMSFWTFQNGYDGLVMGCGIYSKPHRNQDEPYEIIEDTITAITSFIHTHIISTFREINMTREEYLLLKAVALFE